MDCTKCIHYRGEHTLCEKWIIYPDPDTKCSYFETAEEYSPNTATAISGYSIGIVNEKTDCKTCIHYEESVSPCKIRVAVYPDHPYFEDKCSAYTDTDICMNCVYFVDRDMTEDDFFQDPNIGDCTCVKVYVHKYCPVNRWCKDKYEKRIRLTDPCLSSDSEKDREEDQ